MQRSLMLVTALAPHIGLSGERGGRIAKAAHAGGTTLRERKRCALGYVSGGRNSTAWCGPKR